MKHGIKLLLAACLGWAACSHDLAPEDNPQSKVYSLTVDASKGEDGQNITRALNNDLSFTWATTDNVYVYPWGWSHILGTLNPKSDLTGSTRTKLDGNVSTQGVKVGDELVLLYPRDEWSYTGQDGTLATISSKYDYATANVSVLQIANKILASNAIFAAEQAIVKFTLKNGSNDLNVNSLTISANGLKQNSSTTGDITITPSSATHEIYAALSGINGQVTLTATAGNNTYSYTTPSAKTFTNGGYYAVTVQMTKNPEPYPEPLTLECAAADGCSVWVTDYGTLDYKVDNGDWRLYTGEINQIDLSYGQKVSFRGEEATRNYMQIHCNGLCYVYGNVMSLLSRNNYATMTELPYDNTFRNLFMKDYELDDVHITHAPGKDLVLPATTLQPNCYLNMFNGCYELNYVKCLATNVSAAGCTTNWLEGASPSGTFVKAAGFDGWERSDSGIPSDWTVIDN